jgi:hypothetical protein
MGKAKFMKKRKKEKRKIEKERRKKKKTKKNQRKIKSLNLMVRGNEVSEKPRVRGKLYEICCVYAFVQ